MGFTAHFDRPINFLAIIPEIKVFYREETNKCFVTKFAYDGIFAMALDDINKGADTPALTSILFDRIVVHTGNK